MTEFAHTSASPLAAPPTETVSSDGARVEVHVQLPPGSQVEVVVDARAADGVLIGRRSLRLSNPPAWRQRAALWARGLESAWPAWLFGAALVVYLAVRLVGLEHFPIYFFTDEAVQTMRAADLVRDHLMGPGKELLPTFFRNGNQLNLSTSVYLQVIPYLLFDRSVWVTRATSVLAMLLAALALGRILRDIYGSSHAWAGVLLLSSMPAWLLHSRTAFETALASSFYAAFLWTYMLYRTRSPNTLYAALVFGALAFYTYSPMQMIMPVTAVLLLAFDARYHWQHRAVLLRGLGLALLLALPYARFLLNHPGANAEHLDLLASYWTKDLPLTEKLGRFGLEYVRGLDFTYWFLPNDTDLVRHRFGGAPHLLRLALPLLVLGLIRALRNLQFAPNRAILAAVIAVPSGAALVGVGITRLLAMVIPAALLCALGLLALMDWLGRYRLRQPALAVGIFLLLGVNNAVQIDDALTYGPTWFHNYGLSGMQYGARQVFAAVEQQAAAHPERKVMLSPAWSNGTDVVARFFSGDQRPYELGTIEGYLLERQDDLADTLFVMLPEELQMAARSGKVSDLRLEHLLLNPDGTPGFYFVRMHYSGSFDHMLATEKLDRLALRQNTLAWEGVETVVRYSVIDLGQIADAFDGAESTVMRSMEANPLRLELHPTTQRSADQVRLMVGGEPTEVTLRVYPADAGAARTYRQTVAEASQPRWVAFGLGDDVAYRYLEIAVRNLNEDEPAHVHLWEVSTR